MDTQESRAPRLGVQTTPSPEGEGPASDGPMARLIVRTSVWSAKGERTANRILKPSQKLWRPWRSLPAKGM